MKTYLVDFENVKSKGLVGMDRLTEDDHVIIFYSENSDTISFEMHCMVMKARAAIDYMKVRVGGKNALDFQLSTLLGYLVAKGNNTHIFVISNDRGFDKLHDFWENTFEDSPDCKVFRTANISAAINYARYNTKPVEEPEYEETEYSYSEPAAESESTDSTVTDAKDAEAQHLYDEESKVVEIELGGEVTDTNSDDTMVIPDSMAAAVISHAEETHTPDYVEEVSVSKPIGQSGRQNLPRMPKTIAPNIRHPMLTADEDHAQLYEPLYEEFLQTPEAQDKHALLAKFMRGATDDQVSKMSELMLRSASKSELHNLLQQQYDNDTSARLYNKVKRNYYFLKRVLREEAPGIAADPAPAAAAEIIVPDVRTEEIVPEEMTGEAKDIPAAENAGVPENEAAAKADETVENSEQPAEATEQSKPKPKRGRPRKNSENAAAEKTKTEKKKPEKGREKPVKEKPAKEKAAAEKKRPHTSDELAEPKKVDADMKKKLHELLDGKADQDEFSGIVAVINSTVSRQQLYVNMMQRFNKDRGRELYNIIKDEYVRFTAEERSALHQEKTPKKRGRKPGKAAESDKKFTDADSAIRELCGDKFIDDAEFGRFKSLVSEAENVRSLYYSTIKTYGKKRGGDIYNAVKAKFKEISDLLGENGGEDQE